MEAGFSGIILAGGGSRRMGRDKAELILGGKTLVRRQIDKMLALGITDIMLSGRDGEKDARFVPDIYPDHGPLGGLHACLRAAENSACLVLSVDVPLVPVRSLDMLMGAYLVYGREAALLEHGGKVEPLIGVYSSALADRIEEQLLSGENAVRRMLDRVRCMTAAYTGEEALLTNCNTPEDYERLKKLFSR